MMTQKNKLNEALEKDWQEISQNFSSDQINSEKYAVNLTNKLLGWLEEKNQTDPAHVSKANHFFKQLLNRL